jgi:hypothetical protein
VVKHNLQKATDNSYLNAARAPHIFHPPHKTSRASPTKKVKFAGVLIPEGKQKLSYAMTDDELLKSRIKTNKDRRDSNRQFLEELKDPEYDGPRPFSRLTDEQNVAHYANYGIKAKKRQVRAKKRKMKADIQAENQRILERREVASIHKEGQVSLATRHSFSRFDMARLGSLRRKLYSN